MMKFLTVINGGESTWALFSLVVFFSFFVGILIWVYRKPKKDFQEVNLLPLEDGTIKEEKVNE
ncbi:MAG: CcoQ/FixQ family Cbb3-type cytochrome c oxidase assembly chaperone [Acidobacteria bacterium]|nr:MAG: CcoQ/FixQ family Cbb3-type cytochrome c oxidase assembly chaperone [Acidobacteriota bacterium]PIE91223.1 MAG: CcoQ/FixQ family Cbb3-type cytochrome c oxidase assembly chaperone [Acidobacteriota bacterium]